VAVGDGGVIHTSSDGASWDDGQRPVLFTLNKVIYGNGEFVAVGNSGSIITSSNAVDWAVQSSGASNDLYAVAFGNGRFVACGLNGQLTVSTDGTNWTPGTNNSVGPAWITFGNGVFVAAGPGATVEVSADGQTWASFGLPFLGSSWQHVVYQVEYGNGMFVAVTSGDTGSYPAQSGNGSFFHVSVDGTNWVRKTYVNFGPVNNWYSHRFLAFLNGAFHEVTYGPSYGTVPISITLDGTSYISKYAPTNAGSAESMAFGNGRYVLFADGGLSWYSADETNWVVGNSGFQNEITHIIGGHSNLVAFGSSLPVLVSADGVTFSAASNSPTGVLTAGAFDETNYVAVGSTIQAGHPFTYIGEIYTSSNSIDWVRRTSNANQPLSSICRGPSRWVAVGGSGTVTTSPNTLAWTLRSSGTANDLDGVAFGNGIYVAVGNIGTVITSSDGTAWDVQFSGTTFDLLSVKFLNGQFIATGSGGTIITSSDGATWTNQDSGTTASLFSVAYGYGGYLACGYDDVSNPSVRDIFLTSSNGIDWQDISGKIPTATTVRLVSYINQSFWAVGDGGTILRSDVADGIPHLAGVMLPAHSGVKLKVIFNPGAGYRVQFRTNLFTDTWHDVYTQTNPTTSETWTDTNACQLPAGYYRIISP